MFYKVLNVSEKTKIGTVNVVLRSIVDGKKKDTVRSTGVPVHKDHFNTKTGKVTGRDPLHVEKNERIHAHGAEMAAIERELKWAGLVPDKQAVERVQRERDEVPAQYAAIKAARIRNVEDQHAQLVLDVAELEAKLKEKRAQLESVEIYLNKRPKPMLLSKLIDDYKAMKAKEKVKPGTLKNFTVLKNVVGRFNKQVLLTDMDLDFFTDFQAHLVDRGVTNKSTLEMTGKLKTVFRYYASKHGISTAFLSDFKPVEDGAPNAVLFMTPQQLADLEALDIPAANNGQMDVRRQFLFAVETGLRRSDYQVQESDIQYSKEYGEELVVITTKTSKVATIPFTEKARQLFTEANFNFRLIKEAQFNQTLRALCKKLPSMQDNVTVFRYVGKDPKKKTLPRWKWMTSHVARKTYAHNALSKGASRDAVAEWLGHKSTAMLDKHYSNRAELARQEAYKVLKTPRKKRASTVLS